MRKRQSGNTQYRGQRDRLSLLRGLAAEGVQRAAHRPVKPEGHFLPVGIDGDQQRFLLVSALVNQRLLRRAVADEGDPAPALQGAVRLPQFNQAADVIQQRLPIIQLPRNRGTVGRGVLPNVNLVRRRGAEARVHPVIPLHGTAGAGALVAALHTGQPLHVAHTNLVAVVNERRAGHGQQEGKGQLLLVPLHVLCKAGHVVVEK